MEVTFRRTAERRYAVIVQRPGKPALAMDPAPGYDPLVPHDLAHFIVERECAIALGVFGQLAAGGDAATFHRADGVVDRKLRQRGERLVRENRTELARSEQLVYRCMRAWKSGEPSADEAVERVCASLDEISEHWRKLAAGEAITLAWPTTRHRRRVPRDRPRGRRRVPRNRPSNRGRSTRH
jgi:hypothetical protein